MKDGFVERKCKEFVDKNNYFPKMFNPYNCCEIKDYAPTLTTNCGNTGSSSAVLITEENKIIMKIIPQQVRVRKYEVDIDGLKKLLKEHKKNSKLTNKEIANKLDKPLTLVEHWFRGDSSFSIPSEDIWYELKELLGIETNDFDDSITTFEIKDGIYDKANRVYDSRGIAPTLTCVSAENERYIINDGRDKVMWKNDLEKFNFKMDEIRVADFFSGIGALHKSLKKLGLPVKITNISEIDCDAIISYAGIHIENFKDLEFEYPSVEEMKEWLIKRNIGYSYEKDKSSVPRMKLDKLKLVYKASVLLNNLGDISKIDYKDIEDFDLMNLSFSCTDLSGAGKQKGMKNEDGTPTRSGLYVYGVKAIREKMPKYVMIENVKGLIQKKFLDDFYSIVSELDEIGYNCYYPTKEDKKGNKTPSCLNAKDFGIPQNRERIYVICIRKDIDDITFEFPKGEEYGVRLKDLLDDEVDEKYYLGAVKNFFIKNSFDMEAKGNGFRFKPHIQNNANCAFALTTRCGARMDDNFIIDKESDETNFEFSSKNKDLNDTELSDSFDYKIRKLTPKECLRLMGFDDEDFGNALELGVSDSQLYKQAGNSIVVNVLYYIFKNLFNKYII